MGQPWPWEALFAAWGFFAINVLSPGPNVFNTIGLALGSGRRAGLAAAAGVGPGVLMWGLAATFGAAALFRAVPSAELALTLLGGALLLLFGSRYLRRAAGPREGVVRARAGASPRAAFAATLAVLATNPKALTTWLVILSFFPVGETGLGPGATLVVGMGLIATAVHVGYALLFSTAAAAALYARAARWIDAAVGLAFLTLGLRLIVDRLSTLA